MVSWLTHKKNINYSSMYHITDKSIIFFNPTSKKTQQYYYHFDQQFIVDNIQDDITGNPCVQKIW